MTKFFLKTPGNPVFTVMTVIGDTDSMTVVTVKTRFSLYTGCRMQWWSER
jgi:hypothetical protein